jgi:hypothetical protein
MRGAGLWPEMSRQEAFAEGKLRKEAKSIDDTAFFAPRGPRA